MRGSLFALVSAISVSSTALTQQTGAVAHEAVSSCAQSAASYLDRDASWLKKGEFERAIFDAPISKYLADFPKDVGDKVTVL
jgi:hypothetical protein